MDVILPIFSQRLKQLRRDRKITQKAMAELLADCELGVNAIRQINDKKGMASYSLARIADALDCSVDYLLGLSDQR